MRVRTAAATCAELAGSVGFGEAKQFANVAEAFELEVAGGFELRPEPASMCLVGAETTTSPGIATPATRAASWTARQVSLCRINAPTLTLFSSGHRSRLHRPCVIQRILTVRLKVRKDLPRLKSDEAASV